MQPNTENLQFIIILVLLATITNLVCLYLSVVHKILFPLNHLHSGCLLATTNITSRPVNDTGHTISNSLKAA